MKSKKYDERQLYIRGQVYFHGVMVALLLLIINAFLQDHGIVWASGFQQNLLIFIMVTTVISVESLLRGAYFGTGDKRWTLIGLFGTLALVLLILSIGQIAQGAALLEGGALSDEGAHLLFGAMFLCTAVAGVAKELSERCYKGE